MNYIIEFHKEISIKANNDKEAIDKAIEELKKQIEEKGVEKLFYIYPEKF